VAKAAQHVREEDAASEHRSPKQVGRQLRHVRRKQGLSRTEVARSAGLTRRELAAYERGRVEIPESDLWCLAGSCGVDVDELLPRRHELRIDSTLSTLAIGDSIRHLRSPAEPDGMLREYLAMIYELRNLAPGSTVPLREADLATLADALGGSPEAIEARLVEVVGANREEAARLRAMILRPAALEAGDPTALPVRDGGSAESFAAAILTEPPPELDEFLAAPRVDDDPFAGLAPLEPLITRGSPDPGDDARASSDPIASLPIDPFAAPPDLAVTIEPADADALDLAAPPLAASLRPDPFAAPGTGPAATTARADGFLVDLPDDGVGAADARLSPIVPEHMVWAEPDVARTDDVVAAAIPVSAPYEPSAPSEPSEPHEPSPAPAPHEPSGGIVLDAGGDWVAGAALDEPVAPIAWRAAAPEPGVEGPPAAVAPPADLTPAGAGWQVGGMFPATAMADDGALALRRADTRWALSDLSTPADVIAEAVVDFAAGNGFGILFRAGLDAQDQLYGYSFDIDAIAGGGSYLLRQWEANRPHWRPLAQTQVVDPSCLLGRRTVALALRGDALTVDVDGERVLFVPSLSRASIDLGREPCRGDRLGVQAPATAEVTVDQLSALQH